ncbi:hypothetical protein AMK59_2115 [Oryctes borbonicus]|uniref:U3 small nucleolar ribonucleoprotein protein MPP10 n=1 Tax=Oryctes borbonicus TaxID=1629725 RepID=A0A0T6BF98_9SCAR|nr:hypothetical protein AMK59_2115 [Oryctes borbonicus]
MNITLEKLIDNFNNITEKPENFISPENDHSNEIKLFVKDSYDFMKTEEDKIEKSQALPELIIEDFDLEQIWQQIELQNEDLLNKSVVTVSKFVVSKSQLLFKDLENLKSDEDDNYEITNSEGESDHKSENNESEISKFVVSKSQLLFKDLENNLKSDEENNYEITNSEEESDHISENNESEISITKNSDSSSDNNDNISDDEDDKLFNKEKCDSEEAKSRHRSIVDDEFFKLDEMEEFLKSEEKILNRTSNDDSGNESKDDAEEEIDYFESGSDLNEENDDAKIREINPRYKDFFKPQERENIKRNKLEENNDPTHSENENNSEQKSTFELREERLKNKIKSLEDVALSDKPWQLQGEITAENRPQNSLLEEVLEFDITTRPAPLITEKTTFQLEDIIRQRIKDKVFDSVERKEKPVETPLEYKKKLVLNQEKSKESLAQIYEKEYLQQVEVATGNIENKEEEEPDLHKEIKKMMYTLFRQLDALSNYHFTPKPAAPELKIISNLPAINMEEVAPVATTEASLVAPEEIKNRIKGEIIGKSERSDTDKNRERRKKKKKQQVHANEKRKRENTINKVNPGMGNKYSKERAQKQLEKVVKNKNVDKMDESIESKSIRSSSAFFKQLEEEVKSHIKIKGSTKRKQNTNSLTAKKLKL